MGIAVRWVAPVKMFGTEHVVRGGHWVANVLGPNGEVLGEGYGAEVGNAIYFAHKDAGEGA